ncbi:MAG TPA: hypothetical protein VFQ07_03505, partial [Candidatus Polarisedimenticolia bacterium]|nr:hypothetical protein [Candidatus Polarisedimenticolia bacterium]
MTGEPLDVLARLEEHQSNLRSAPAPPTCALLALPLPAIARALAPEALAARRDEALKQSARMLGGGDGALPIIDLESDARPLPQVLGDLEGRYAALKIWGARDQPGFSRELRSRWRGGLELLDAGVGVWLMDDPRPVLDLGHGVVRVHAGVAAPEGARTLLVGVPPWTDPGSVEGAAYVVDRDRRLGPYS